MMKILGLLFILGIAFVVIKYMLTFAIRLGIVAVTAFFTVGPFTGFLVIINVISSDTAWIITGIATAIGLIYGIYEFFSTPSEFLTDVKEMYNKNDTPPSYDVDGYEINHYPDKRCCGNCAHNMSRSPHLYNSIYCTYDSDYHNVLRFSQKSCCSHWQHF